MASVGNIWVRLMMRDDATKQMQKSMSGMTSMALKFAAGFGAFKFIKDGVSAASDFAENWSIVMAGVGKDTQDTFLDAFSKLKRTSKSQFSDIAATYVGTLKAKGVSEETIKALGPDLFQRLEDVTANFNGTAEATMTAFTSMMSGQAKSMEKLTKGAVVPLVANLDILAERDYGATFDNLAPDEQALTRLNYFMEASAKVPGLAGNSARTIGTLKGQTDLLKKSVSDSAQSIAQNLMPTLAKLAGFLAKVANFVAKNISLIGGLAAAYAAFRIARGFISGIKLAVAGYQTLMAARAAAEGGIAGPALAAAALIGLAAVLGGIAGGVFFSGGSGSGSSASQKTTGSMSNAPISLTVNTNSSGGLEDVTSNGVNLSSQSNTGKGTV